MDVVLTVNRLFGNLLASFWNFLLLDLCRDTYHIKMCIYVASTSVSGDQTSDQSQPNEEVHSNVLP